MLRLSWKLWDEFLAPFHPESPRSFNTERFLRLPLTACGIFFPNTDLLPCWCYMVICSATSNGGGSIRTDEEETHRSVRCALTGEWSCSLMCGDRITGFLPVWPGLTWTSWHTQTDLYLWTSSLLCHSRWFLWLCAACLRGKVHLVCFLFWFS